VSAKGRATFELDAMDVDGNTYLNTFELSRASSSGVTESISMFTDLNDMALRIPLP